MIDLIYQPAYFAYGGMMLFLWLRYKDTGTIGHLWYGIAILIVSCAVLVFQSLDIAFGWSYYNNTMAQALCVLNVWLFVVSFVRELLSKDKRMG